MIEIHTGDLLDFFDRGEVSAIAHCCNCQGVMGSGIAKAIKVRYPSAYSAYKETESIMKQIPAYQGLQLGTISYAMTSSDSSQLTNPRLVINLHAQMFYGYDKKRYVDYEAIYKSLETAKFILQDHNINTLGIPYNMACDRAGGNWNIITAMLHTVFPDADNIRVKVVELPKTK